MQWLFIINTLLIFLMVVITLGVAGMFVYAYWVRGKHSSTGGLTLTVTNTN